MKEHHVLIIEDDDTIRQMYTDALDLAGLSVLSASNGKEGINLALEHHPIVILLDLMMPDIDGNEVAKRIREDKWGQEHARIIFLTNYSNPEDVYEAFSHKPEEYIVKAHTDVKDIVNKVRTAMHKD